MDWSKAKTILIIAFLVTNLILVNVLVRQTRVEEPTIKEEFFQEVIRLLSNKEIEMATELPRDIPHLNTLIVKYDKIGLRELNNRFFQNLGYINTDEEDLGKIIHEEESILVFNKKLILYENKDETALYKELNEEKAIEIGEEFLREKEFNGEDMRLTFVKEENATFYLEYSKVFQDIYIERAYTNFQIDNRGVKRFERLWLIDEEMGDTDIYISTAPKAILELLGMSEVYGKSITDISISYYFDPQRHNYLEDVGEARQGKAVPAWRVQFADGYKVFIDDY